MTDERERLGKFSRPPTLEELKLHRYLGPHLWTHSVFVLYRIGEQLQNKV